MSKTKIQWADESENVFAPEDPNKPGKQKGWMCVKAGPACRNCYAESINKAWLGNGMAFNKANAGNVQWMIKRDKINAWKRKKKRRVYFVNSMTDTFGEFIPDEWIMYLLQGMIEADQHIFQVLTKREDRALELIDRFCNDAGIDELPNHIWVIFSAGNQIMLDKRMSKLREVKAKIKGVSLEPLLESVNISSYLDFLDWVIIGGESGKNARAFVLNWIDKILEQVPHEKIFIKQMGENVFSLENGQYEKVPFLDKKGGEQSEWPPKYRIRNYPFLLS